MVEQLPKEKVTAAQEKREQLRGLLEYMSRSAYGDDLGRVDMVAEQIAMDLDSFSPLTHLDVANMFIESQLDYLIPVYIQYFNIDHEAIATELIRLNPETLVPDYIHNFKANHANIAKELIAVGAGERVMEHIHKFGEEYHDAIARHFLDAGHTQLLKEHRDAFKNLSDGVVATLQEGVD